MAIRQFVAYYRVSTARQGRSGLGLAAQQEAVSAYLTGVRGHLLSELTEIESGKRDDRPKLAEAMRLCRIHNAILIIAKLDRLSRDAHFLLGLQKSEIRFVAADMPEANEMVVGIMAVVAQAERKMIGSRTKSALAAAKRKGVQLGGDRGNFSFVRTLGNAASAKTRSEAAAKRIEDLRPIVCSLRDHGRTLRTIAEELSIQGIMTPRGIGKWSATQVSRILQGGSSATTLIPSKLGAGQLHENEASAAE